MIVPRRLNRWLRIHQKRLNHLSLLNLLISITRANAVQYVREVDEKLDTCHRIRCYLVREGLRLASGWRERVARRRVVVLDTWFCGGSGCVRRSFMTLLCVAHGTPFAKDHGTKCPIGKDKLMTYALLTLTLQRIPYSNLDLGTYYHLLNKDND
jgi:hypothetical protein